MYDNNILYDNNGIYLYTNTHTHTYVCDICIWLLYLYAISLLNSFIFNFLFSHERNIYGG